MKLIRPALLTSLALLAALTPMYAPALASDSQPAPDISKLDYAPLGFYKAGDPLPSTSLLPKPTSGKVFNPSGKWVAYDNNVYESLVLPDRQADDKTTNDPPGNGGSPYGFCPPDPAFAPYGKCDNHQLEYLDYYEQTMKSILGDYGVAVKRYGFDSPGAGTPRPGAPGGAPATAPGRSYNIVASVPGADHPEQSIIVSGHYDVTDNAPAPAWDSSEGHAEVIRMAKIMSDYWRATGTRPAVTVKFAAWDQEESGTLGSIDYIANDIPPGEEKNVRGYFNVDPCAGAYPAFYHGNPSYRIPMMLQLPDPTAQSSDERKKYFEAFNKRALTIVDETMDRLDDTVSTLTGPKPIFVSDKEAAADPSLGGSQRGEVVTALGGLLLFSSDYANFEKAGIPFFNPGPDMFGPHADPSTSTQSSSEGIATIHTPRDQLLSINQLTGPDQTGMTVSDGWAKGMEFCAQMESWYMLQPEMGGAQTSTPEPVAYYEALPNEAIQRQAVRFDATGSYQYAQLATRQYVDEADLSYSWDFGDGSKGTGKTVDHAYTDVGRYQSKLTVRNTKTGQTDTMEIPITVIGSNFTAPVLKPPAATDDDGTFDLSWTFAGTRSGHKGFKVEESDDVATLLDDNADGDPAAKWTILEQGAGGPTAQKWQSSASGMPPLGNLRHSGAASYWTGGSPPGPTATDTSEILQLKQPLSIPKTGEPQLSYWSLLRSESDDQARVEVALTDGNPATKLDFTPIDVQDAAGAVADAGQPNELVNRVADLGAYKDKTIVLRFRFVYGPNDAAASQPFGWYVDDISVRTGTWHTLGTTDKSATSFQAFGRPTGTHAYRVRGTYNDGVETAPSNVETVKVLNGPPAGTQGSGGGGVPGSSKRCAALRGFASARVVPRGRGLRFVVRRAARRPFTVDVFESSSGRRVLRERRVAHFPGRAKSFAWAGKTRRKGGLASGYYYVRFSMRLANGKFDQRRIALQRAAGRFRLRPPHYRREFCATLLAFKVTRPAFGGRTAAPLQVTFTLARAANVAIVVRRGKHVVRRYASAPRNANTPYAFRLPARGLARGDYRVQLVIRRAGRTERRTVTARRI